MFGDVGFRYLHSGNLVATAVYLGTLGANVLPLSLRVRVPRSWAYGAKKKDSDYGMGSQKPHFLGTLALECYI